MTALESISMGLVSHNSAGAERDESFSERAAEAAMCYGLTAPLSEYECSLPLPACHTRAAQDV